MGAELAGMGAFLRDGEGRKEKTHLHANAILRSPSASSLGTLPTILKQALGGQAGRHVYTINKQQ